MPTYGYKCDDCDRLYDRIRKIDERETGGECPRCKSENTVQLMSAPKVVQGGGGGWAGGSSYSDGSKKR